LTPPTRIQLSRRKGWRMPPDTVKVDRSTRWGNPFVVGRHGTQAECVAHYARLAGGHVPISFGRDTYEAARESLRLIRENVGDLRGKNLACWCRLGEPCHADVLLAIANPPTCEEIA